MASQILGMSPLPLSSELPLPIIVYDLPDPGGCVYVCVCVCVCVRACVCAHARVFVCEFVNKKKYNDRENEKSWRQRLLCLPV